VMGLLGAAAGLGTVGLALAAAAGLSAIRRLSCTAAAGLLIDSPFV